MPTLPHSPCRYDSLPYPLFSFHSWLPMRQQHACGHRTPQSSTDHFQLSVNGKTRLTLSPQQWWLFSHFWQESPTVSWYIRPDITNRKRTINSRHVCGMSSSQGTQPFCLKLFPIVKHYSPDKGIRLTSTIILQLLHGPICVNTCRIRGSVTSLDRFPTYLQTRREMRELSLCQTGSSMQTKAS